MSDPENSAAASAIDDADRPGERSDSILDALDMEDVGDIGIEFERQVSTPRSAKFE